MTITIALVGCGRGKKSTPQPARTLYIGDLFQKAARYAEATCDGWHVLSAKHGLVEPDTVLEPYDMVLGNTRTGPPIYAWANSIIDGLERVYAEPIAAGEQLRLVMLAGRHYRCPFNLLVEKKPWCESLVVPMEHLGIGQQKAWLLANTPVQHAA